MKINLIKDYIANNKASFDPILNSKDFYFQKAVDALDKWLDYPIEPPTLEQIIAMDYEAFCQDDELTDIRNAIFALIAYCDTKARDKSKYNGYEDNRTIAAAGIRQNAWVVQLCKYKLDPNSVTEATQSMISYIQSPKTRLPIISERHRTLLSHFLLSKAYDADTFDNEIITSLASDIPCSNPDNVSMIIVMSLYALREAWQRHPVKGLVARAKGWPDELKDDIAASGYGCSWWHMLPVKGQETLKLLRELIKDQGYFEYYLVSNNEATHVAKVCDFALKDDYDQVKEIWKEKTPAWYCEDFNDYNDGEKHAKIVFLINEINKIECPIPIDNFVFYQGSQAPWITHITPFSTIITKSQQAMASNILPLAKILLNHKNLILQGAPGTGKTYNTAELAVAAIEGDSFVGYSNRKELMQKYKEYKEQGLIGFTTFHQSLDYENFIEGIVPEIVDDKIAYRIKSGIFLRMCESAKNNPSRRYVLIIDEINRGNISKIFGELITLLEKDKRLTQTNEITATLPYSGVEFGVPDNVYIIGTMITTDRSTGTIDYALRRRFVFNTIKSDDSKITHAEAKEVYKEVKAFIKKHKLPEDDIEDLMVGHSYFMGTPNDENSDNEIVQKIRLGVIPLLREYIKDGILLAKYDDLEKYEKYWCELKTKPE